MSQAQVTDFFAQRKNNCRGPTKAAKPRGRSSTRARVSEHTDPLSLSVHEEFLRVIDEAAGLKETPEHSPTPRTPKRASEEPAVVSASIDHSTAKKSRPTATKPPDNSTRRTARKKLVLPQDSPQVAPAPSAGVSEETQPAPRPPKTQDPSTAPTKGPTKAPRGCRSKALSREELSVLKSRLQGIKKQAEALNRTPSAPEPTANSLPPTTADPSTAKTATPPASHSPVNKPVTPPGVNDKPLKDTIARAKELAAKVQKRKEERSETTQTPESHSAEPPAYQNYHSLAQATPPGLSLPYQYKLLAERFRCMDTVVAMLFNRSETPTFVKIKKGVQDMTHKRFEESHVGQITAVFPEAYTLRQERNIPTFNSSVQKGSYQLTVEPVIRCDASESRPVLTASRLLERRRIFHHNLVSVVKRHHKVFLSSLEPPLFVPDDKLSRWHPRFNVDTVPVVPPGALPRPPHTESLTSAQEVLDKARALMTPKMERALTSMALKSTEKSTTESKEAPPPQPSPAQTPSVLKGVSQSLLERIRAKEAQKLQAAMTRDPEQDERLLMMSRLGELARILRNVFVAEKKPALIMEVACNRMVSSYTSALSTGEMEKHLRLLAEEASDWLTIVPIRKDFYLKLNKNMELGVILDKLSTRLKEEERL